MVRNYFLLLFRSLSLILLLRLFFHRSRLHHEEFTTSIHSDPVPLDKGRSAQGKGPMSQLIKLVYQTVYCLPYCFHNASSYHCEPVTKQINLTSFLHSSYTSSVEMLFSLFSWPHRSIYFCLSYSEPSTTSSAFVVCLFTLHNTLIPALLADHLFDDLPADITLFVCFLQTTWSTAPPAVHLAAFWRELHPPSGLLT